MGSHVGLVLRSALTLQWPFFLPAARGGGGAVAYTFWLRHFLAGMPSALRLPCLLLAANTAAVLVPHRLCVCSACFAGRHFNRRKVPLLCIHHRVC